MLTAIYSALSKSRMLKLEENLESIYLDWSDWQSGRRVRSSGKGREMEKMKRIVGPSPSSRSGSHKILTCPFRNHSWNVETVTQPCPWHAHKNSWRPVTALPPKTRDFPMVLPQRSHASLSPPWLWPWVKKWPLLGLAWGRDVGKWCLRKKEEFIP